MPELPDIELYLLKLRERILGERLLRIRLFSPFLLRTVSPRPAEAEGRVVEGLSRIGKRIAIQLEGDVFLVLHLMIAGRLQWKAQAPAGKPLGKIALASLEFANGVLILTEASPKKRASLHLVQGREALAELDPGGLEPLKVSKEEFAAALRAKNRTIKRALTTPSVLSGIGNAYSDEILHAARLTPIRLTGSLTDEELLRLYEATVNTLLGWCAKLAKEFENRFPGPGDVTAFRPGFAVHGKYGQPCPACGKPVQRIRYAENEANYCAVCQNGSRLLADRSLSRLLKADWPKTLEEWEAMK